MKLFALCATVLAFSAALASCQKESANDKPSTPEAPAVRVIHVDLDANVAETKASYAEKVVTIQADDKLYIALTGPESAWTATGTLTFATDKFSGDIIVKTGSYAGSDPITDAKDLTATFLPKGYSTVGYLSDAGVATATKAFYAGAKSAAVPQLVHLTATVSDLAGSAKSPLTLTPQNAVLCYSINANKLSAGAHTVSVSDGTTTISGSVTAVAEAATTFAVAFPASASAKDYTLSISGYNNVVKSGKTLTAGKVVNITTDVTVNANAPLSGVFTVDAGKTVKFSKGNLQATYNGSSWSWAFAANQWDYIGNAEGNTKVSGTSPFVSGYSGTSTTVDLFGWSTSTTCLGINNSSSNIYTGNFADWGSDATVQAGIGTGWRTLTSAEWTYLLNTRTGIRYCKATVNSVSGLVIFPDSYSHPTGVTAIASANNEGAAYTTNSWTGENWTKMETAGAVFLPAAGYRSGTSVSDVGSYGYYWSSTPSGTDLAYRLRFNSGSVNRLNDFRDYGFSVRLVQNQ